MGGNSLGEIFGGKGLSFPNPVKGYRLNRVGKGHLQVATRGPIS